MTSQKLRILVAVDFSEDSRRAIDQALAWALRAPAEITLVHVIDTGADNVSHQLAHDFEELKRTVEAELRRFGPDPHQREPLGDVHRHVAAGTPATEILNVAARQRADLIFLGTHGRSRVRRALMGSVAEKVLRGATCPVLCVKPTDVLAPRWQRLLCAVDFSEPSRRALAVAIDLARRLDLELLLLHVYHLPVTTSPEGMVWMGGADLLGEVQKAAEAGLETWRREAAAAGVRVATTAVLGSSAEEIVGCARERATSAIVMGTKGRTGLAHLLLGSVAERVVHTAPCPVLTVPPARSGRRALRPRGIAPRA